MRTFKLLLITSMLIFIGCEKIENDCPECIRDLTRQFAKRTLCDTGASVSEWQFKEAYVYVFSEGTCGADFGASVYNQNCESIGYLGGIAGNTKIDGIEFYQNAKRLKLIWEQD